MSVPSNDRLASLALKIAGEVYQGGCVDCGAHGVELHEIYGRTMRPILGATVCILGTTLAPLCQKCHRNWEKDTTEKQLETLQYILVNGYVSLRQAQVDQMIALKARCAVCK